MEDEQEVTKLFENLIFNEIPEEMLSLLVSGGLYFEHMNGVPLSEYWNQKQFDNRDEFFVMLNSYFSLVSAINKTPHNNEWRLKFDVAYLFQLKSNAQSAKSLDILANSGCYADSYVICRAMISRVNLLMLCALNPNLFDQWLKNPKDERFLDGHVRSELINNGLNTIPHFYELMSEIIHGHATGLADIGYLQKGLFTEIKPIRNQIYVMAKFIIAMSYQLMLSMALQDCNGKVPDGLRVYDDFFQWLKKHYLVHNRIDQLFTFMAEDRHTEKIGKDKYVVGSTYNYDEIRVQLSKFHRTGQSKKLSKKYNT